MPARLVFRSHRCSGRSMLVYILWQITQKTNHYEKYKGNYIYLCILCSIGQCSLSNWWYIWCVWENLRWNEACKDTAIKRIRQSINVYEGELICQCPFPYTEVFRFKKILNVVSFELNKFCLTFLKFVCLFKQHDYYREEYAFAWALFLLLEATISPSIHVWKFDKRE